MAFFKPRPPHSALLRPPLPIKMSTPEGDRLAAIMEGSHPARAKHLGPKISPNPNHFRWSLNSKESHAPTLPRFSADMTPPVYVVGPTMHEKLNTRRRQGRGGWGRLCLIVGLVLLALAIALGVGLGVGLTKKHKSHGDAAPVSNASAATQSFPLGQYGLAPALVEQQSDCTSNAATWSCYAYTAFASNPASSAAFFSWTLSNTSTVYPTNSSTKITDSTGVPANVSITAANNPFGIEFEGQSITYINNASDPRYTFSFTMSKQVFPGVALTDDNNQATTCFFNATVFSAVLYLSDSESSPKQNYSSPSVMSGLTPWPYAVEVRQTSRGGRDVPACYYTTDRVVGARVLSGLTAQPESDTCLCEYRG